MKQYRNHLQLKKESVGNERRLELLSDILSGGTFLPKTVEYRDMDEAFKKWVEGKLYMVSDEGKELPTMVLFSNQRFSEYTQSWEYTDENKNLILNFKTITRENNPQHGNIQSRLWNIPGDSFFLMKRRRVLDDNGTESFLDLKMKQPMAVDLEYKVSIFVTKYQLINDFNLMINKLFASKQCYLWPNNHPMPMTLESINDESSYQINDRQFYGQTYSIKLMGYVITEEDFKIEQIPLKNKLISGSMITNKIKSDVEIDEETHELTVTFPSGCNKAKFVIDCDFEAKTLKFTNVKVNKKINFTEEGPIEEETYNYQIFINDEEVNSDKFLFKTNDEIEIKIKKMREKEMSVLKFL